MFACSGLYSVLKVQNLSDVVSVFNLQIFPSLSDQLKLAREAAKGINESNILDSLNYMNCDFGLKSSSRDISSANIQQRYQFCMSKDWENFLSSRYQ